MIQLFGSPSYCFRPCSLLLITLVALLVSATDLAAQYPPYDVFPDAQPPYYRVRYEASKQSSEASKQASEASIRASEASKQSRELQFPVSYTVWIPAETTTLRGVVVHQHGCGEGSCKSGLTGAFDLHWQALAKKHNCALLAASYEQPQQADCQLWCDPRNGSAAAFQRGLDDLAAQSGHPELSSVPWALWGHSGGGHWCGGMVMMYPQRVVAAWLRSGVPLFEPNPERPKIKPHVLVEDALRVPIMCNPGTKEGVTVTDGRFAGVWPANQVFFHAVRRRGGLIGIAVDPLTAHECGNQRYLAIRWLDICLEHRLPKTVGDPLVNFPPSGHWLAEPKGTKAWPATKHVGDPNERSWLPNQDAAKLWMQYVKDTKVVDTTDPPAPTDVRIIDGKLVWHAEADLQSGLSHFLIRRDGQTVARVPAESTNRFGRDLFQGLQYSDTPLQPLSKMEYLDSEIKSDVGQHYQVIAVNTVGLLSKPASVSHSLTQ